MIALKWQKFANQHNQQYVVNVSLICIHSDVLCYILIDWLLFLSCRPVRKHVFQEIHGGHLKLLASCGGKTCFYTIIHHDDGKRIMCGKWYMLMSQHDCKLSREKLLA